MIGQRGGRAIFTRAPDSDSGHAHRNWAQVPFTCDGTAPRLLEPDEKPDAWKPIDLTLCTAGFVKNEREQYGRWDSIRELITNQYDAGATDVRISVRGSSIEIVGNGRPIESVNVLKEIFTDIKRNNKTVTDADGNERAVIGEKGRGRFSFVRDADELVISSGFGDFRLCVNEGGGLDSRMRERGSCPGAGFDGGTHCTMRLKDGEFDLASITEYLERTYMYFEGSNLRLSLNGEPIKMRRFNPQYSAWLVIPGEYALRFLENEFDALSVVRRARAPPGSANSAQPPMLVVLEEEMAWSLEEQKRFKMHRLDIEVCGCGENDPERSSTLFLSQLVPVKRSMDIYVSMDFNVSAVVNTDLRLEPSRKGFATIESGRNALSLVDPSMIDSAIGIAVKDALVCYAESNYVELGWDKYEKYRSHSLTRLGRAWLPSLELMLKYHEDHATLERTMRVEEIAEYSKEKALILFDSGDEKYEDIIDRLIQQGHLAMKSDKNEGTAEFLRFNHVNFVLAGDQNFNELALKAGFKLLDVGAKSDEEGALLDMAQSIAAILSIKDVKVDIATFTSRDAAACYEKPEYVIFNRANPIVESFLESIGDSGDEGVARMALMLKLSKTVIAELAHHQISNKSGDKLEHEKTIAVEKALYERLVESLSDALLAVASQSKPEEDD